MMMIMATRNLTASLQSDLPAVVVAVAIAIVEATEELVLVRVPKQKYQTKLLPVLNQVPQLLIQLGL